MMVSVLLIAVVLVAATGLGLWWRARNGRFTPVSARVLDAARHRPTASPGDHADDSVGAGALTPEEIGTALGTDATFVQFSSKVCAPCRRAGIVLGEIAAERQGLVHVELDVEDHLNLVRRFGVLRTPTVLLLDDRGVVIGRISGAMNRAQALSALESCPSAARGV